MTDHALLNALDAIAARQLAVRQEYALLATLPEAVTATSRDALLDYYAGLEEAAAGLRRILAPAPEPRAVIEHVPPSRLATLPTPPARPAVKTTATVTSGLSWWARPNVNMAAEVAERFGRAS